MKLVVARRWLRPDFWPLIMNFVEGTSRRATFGETRAYMRSRVVLRNE